MISSTLLTLIVIPTIYAVVKGFCHPKNCTPVKRLRGCTFEGSRRRSEFLTVHVLADVLRMAPA
jgi:hypothetical protein